MWKTTLREQNIAINHCKGWNNGGKKISYAQNEKQVSVTTWCEILYFLIFLIETLGPYTDNLSHEEEIAHRSVGTANQNPPQSYLLQ